MEEERRLYDNLKTEFDGLCVAVNDKVARMRSLADELDVFQQQSSSNQAATLPKKQKKRAQYAAHKSATTDDLMVPPQETLWQHRVESLDVSFFRKSLQSQIWVFMILKIRKYFNKFS